MQIGETLNGRFKILSILGKGGMGAVYKALDTATNQQVAIKELLTNGANNSAATPELFKREFEILSQLDHPNIVKVFNLFEAENRSFCIMELLAGESLKEWIASHPKRETTQSLELLRQLAGALRHVHEKGIIHHDIHPNNIRVISSLQNDGAQVKLIDFGISLLRERQTQKEVLIGVDNYKAPEHSRGERLDYTADVYCFGLIAFEVLSGKQPFSLKEKGLEGLPIAGYAAMAMHALKEVPTIKGLNKKIAYETNRMVQICMEKEPAHRYQSMDELVEQIEDLVKKAR